MCLHRYRPKEIQVTENGISRKGEDGLEKAQAVQDLQRVNFFKQYVSAAADAVNIDKVGLFYYHYEVVALQFGDMLRGCHVLQIDGTDHV